MNDRPFSAAGNQTALDQRDDQADQLRSRINEMRIALRRFFVAKHELIDLLIIAAVANEPLLLVGPPGSAKSDLIVKFKDALGITDADFFQYTLTPATHPSEIVGDVRTDGEVDARPTLPTAKLAFINEVFQTGSPTLNVLLKLLDGRGMLQSAAVRPVQRQLFFAASNAIPEHEGLSGLRERFVLKAESLPVHNDHFGDLINVGLRGDVHLALGQKPWAKGHCTLEDIRGAQHYMSQLLHRTSIGTQDVEGSSGTVDVGRFSADTLLLYQRLIRTLVREDRIFISDRRLIKLSKLLCTRAWLFGNGIVTVGDLSLLAYVGETCEELALLRDKVPVLLAKL